MAKTLLTVPAGAALRLGLVRYTRDDLSGLVTPLRYGMNLAAKAIVAAQDPADPGVLVRARFAGAAEKLTDALLVNPNDPDGIAEAMHAALGRGMKERQARHAALRRAVFGSTAARYRDVLVGALAA